MTAVWFAAPSCAQNTQESRPAISTTPVQSDQPGTPLKSEPAGTSLKSEPSGALLKPELAGAPVKSEPNGTLLKSEPAGAPIKSEPAGALLPPELSGTPVKQEPARQEKISTVYELRKKHRAAITELKNSQAEEIAVLRESLKSKPQSEIRRAMKARKAGQSASLKALRDANKAEMAQLKKDHPGIGEQVDKNTTPKILPSAASHEPPQVP